MKKIAVLLFIMVIIFSGCANNSEFKVGEQMSSINESQVIEESDYYKVIRSDLTYYYTIFDKNHNIAKSDGPLNRQPHILMVDKHLVRFTLQAGTGISTQWGYYYDIQTDTFSEIFYSILDQNNGKVAYVENKNKKVIIRDIFSSDKYYYEISSFTHSLSSDVIEPITNVKFVNDGESVEISYISGDDYLNVTETIDLI